MWLKNQCCTKLTVSSTPKKLVRKTKILSNELVKSWFHDLNESCFLASLLFCHHFSSTPSGVGEKLSNLLFCVLDTVMLQCKYSYYETKKYKWLKISIISSPELCLPRSWTLHWQKLRGQFLKWLIGAL